MLKLIAKESPIYRHEVSNKVQTPMCASIQSPQCSFLWDFQELSAGIYKAKFQDTFHELACDFIFELKKIFLPSGADESYLQPVLVGDFPSIDTRKFLQKVFWDEYLHGMILIHFQLKILEQLLLFCETKYATHLFLTINETNQDYFGIYQRFTISEEQIPCANGEKTEIAIPTHVSVYDELVDFMEEVEHKFRQILWSDHRTNPIYRHYLKSEALI